LLLWKRIVAIYGFHFLKTCTTMMCKQQTQKTWHREILLKILDEKVTHKMFKPFCNKGCLQWSACWLAIWNTLVRIDKLPTLVGAKMYTFARFYLCSVSLSFHIVYCS
jgi:hypothetical protein